MKKNLIFLAIAIGLSAYVYFVEIKGGEERDKAKEISEKIMPVEKDSVQHLAIHSARGQFQLSRTVDGWQLEKPVQTIADQSTVNSFLTDLTGGKKTRTFNIDPNDWYSYGFGPMQIRIITTLRNGHRDSLYLGDKSNIGSDIYAARVDSIVHLVTGSLKTNAEKTLFDWRDKKSIHFIKNDVREFTLINSTGEFEFVKDGFDWKMMAPIQTSAEKEKVDEILNKLVNGNIKSVLAETPDKKDDYSLNQPFYQIDLSIGANKARAGVRFSGLRENVAYGKDNARPHIFEVDSSFIKPFKAGLYDLRDKRMLDFNQDEVDRVNLLYQGQLMTVVKDTADNWSLSTGEKARSWKVTSLIRKINDLKADRFVEENPSYFMNYGLVNPEGKIELFSSDEKMAELNIGFLKKEQVYVYNPRMKPVMAIKESTLKELFPDKSEIVEEVEEPAAAEGTEE